MTEAERASIETLIDQLVRRGCLEMFDKDGDVFEWSAALDVAGFELRKGKP